jgi:hypothetical protein
MKRYCTLVLLGLLVVVAGAATATSRSLNGFTPKVMPVLVRVDSRGKVVEASPSIELSPRFDRLLRQTLDEMITRAASDHGRPVASQFVINLALQASPRTDGEYDARFVYVSTSPVPSGSWYWSELDGHRLALVSRDAGHPRRRVFDHRAWEHPWVPQGTRALNLPAQNSARSAAPVVARRSGRAGR